MILKKTFDMVLRDCINHKSGMQIINLPYFPECPTFWGLVMLQVQTSRKHLISPFQVACFEACFGDSVYLTSLPSVSLSLTHLMTSSSSSSLNSLLSIASKHSSSGSLKSSHLSLWSSEGLALKYTRSQMGISGEKKRHLKLSQ